MWEKAADGVSSGRSPPGESSRYRHAQETRISGEKFIAPIPSQGHRDLIRRQPRNDVGREGRGIPERFVVGGEEVIKEVQLLGLHREDRVVRTELV